MEFHKHIEINDITVHIGKLIVSAQNITMLKSPIITKSRTSENTTRIRNYSSVGNKYIQNRCTKFRIYTHLHDASRCNLPESITTKNGEFEYGLFLLGDKSKYLKCNK